MDMPMTAQLPAAGSPEDVGHLLYQRRRVILRPDEPLKGAVPSSAVSIAGHLVVTLECDDVELLALTAEGLTPSGIGRRMALNERTVRRRLSRLCERLGVSTPMQAVVWAVRHGVI
jgi:DNA-binding CsgD family transcriptional regulator